MDSLQGGLSHRVSLEVPSGVCVGVRVGRSKTGLSHRVSVEVSSGVCRGQRSAVTQGVSGGAV